MNIFAPYFTKEELGLSVNNNSKYEENMYLLVKLGLNAIRKKYGPVVITSGFRDQATHERLKAEGYNPSETSQHLTGEAVDFIVKGKDMREVFEWLRTWWPGQLFYYQRRGHVHIALPNTRLQRAGRLYARVLEAS